MKKYEKFLLKLQEIEIFILRNKIDLDKNFQNIINKFFSVDYDYSICGLKITDKYYENFMPQNLNFVNKKILNKTDYKNIYEITINSMFSKKIISALKHKRLKINSKDLTKFIINCYKYKESFDIDEDNRLKRLICKYFINRTYGYIINKHPHFIINEIDRYDTFGLKYTTDELLCGAINENCILMNIDEIYIDANQTPNTLELIQNKLRMYDFDFEVRKIEEDSNYIKQKFKKANKSGSYMKV